MGKKSRNKGYRGEHELVCLLKRAGINAVRVPLSGATEFAKGDVIVERKVCEVKLRHDGFRELYKWLEEKDWLFLKADRKPYLVVMKIDDLIELLKGGSERVESDKG
ncbi:MAG: hypothetical protein QW328_08755 [Nitrososphaerota archaeon]